MNNHLSDLFFNYEHPSFDQLQRDATDVDGSIDYQGPEVRNALMDDAAPFLEAIFGLTGLRYSAEELVTDFISRL